MIGLEAWASHLQYLWNAINAFGVTWNSFYLDSRRKVASNKRVESANFCGANLPHSLCTEVCAGSELTPELRQGQRKNSTRQQLIIPRLVATWHANIKFLDFLVVPAKRRPTAVNTARQTLLSFSIVLLCPGPQSAGIFGIGAKWLQLVVVPYNYTNFWIF